MGIPKGYKHNKVAKEKMSRTRTGRKHSKEHCAAISKALKGKPHTRKEKKCLRCGKAVPMVHNQLYCCRKCSLGARGVTLLHSLAFDRYQKQCAICGSTEELVGDHDHILNKARGILCRLCNLGIGNLRTAENCEKAAFYLRGEIAR